MNYYVILFIMISIAKFQFCSESDDQIGMLQKAEYNIWGNNFTGSVSVSQKVRVNENYQEETSRDVLGCHTKIVNCCLVCLASVPCCLCIASCLLD